MRRLRTEAPEFDCRIPQSLILETTGKVEEALSLVAQIDDAATVVRQHSESCVLLGTPTGLQLFQEQGGET